VNVDGTVYYLNGQSGVASSNLDDVLNDTGYTHPDSVSVLPTNP
jgi:hypothetical protein